MQVSNDRIKSDSDPNSERSEASVVNSVNLCVLEVYPFFPYSYAVALVPIFLLTDLLLYKPTMLLEVLGQIGFRASLVFGGSVDSQILGTAAYGLASASEVAFFSYVYAKLERDQYQR